MSSDSERADGRESDSVFRVTGAVMRIFIDAEDEWGARTSIVCRGGIVVAR